MLPITLFLASMLFLVVVAWVKKVPLLSTYGVFIGFQFLYNFAPWITAYEEVETPIFKLVTNLPLTELQLYLTASANLCFGLCFALFYKRVRFEVPRRADEGFFARQSLFLKLIPLFLLAAVLGKFYGWNEITTQTMTSSGPVAGGMYTVTAYVKLAFVVGYLYYLYRFGFDKWAALLLVEHTIVMLLDGARTTYLPIALLSIFLAVDKVSNGKRMAMLYVVAVVGLLFSLLTRALVLTSDSSFLVKVFAPVMVEGTMGDYPALQSLYAVMHGIQAKYTFGLSYIVDPFVWFVPTGKLRDSLSVFQHWVDSISPALEDEYSPMGGFYYGGEATAAFSYAGPALVTTVYGLWLVWIERKKNVHRLFYLAAVPTLGLLFIKTIFGNLVKIFLIQFFALGCLKLAGRVRLVLQGRSGRYKSTSPVPAEKSDRSLPPEGHPALFPDTA